MSEEKPMTEEGKKPIGVKVTNQYFSLIMMPNEIVLSILRAAGGTIADPSMFDKEHREEVHKQINEIICKLVPTYVEVDLATIFDNAKIKE